MLVFPTSFESPPILCSEMFLNGSLTQARYSHEQYASMQHNALHALSQPLPFPVYVRLYRRTIQRRDEVANIVQDLYAS